MSLAIWNYVAPRLRGLTPSTVKYKIEPEKHRSDILTRDINGIDQDLHFESKDSFWAYEHSGGFISMRIQTFRGKEGLFITTVTYSHGDPEESIRAHLKEMGRYFSEATIEKVEKAAAQAQLSETRLEIEKTKKKLLVVEDLLKEHVNVHAP